MACKYGDSTNVESIDEKYSVALCKENKKRDQGNPLKPVLQQFKGKMIKPELKLAKDTRHIQIFSTLILQKQ